MTKSYCKDSQITSLKLYLIVTHFVKFKHNFPKEIETFFKKKWIKEKSLKKLPFSLEWSFHIHNWLIISLEDFCIVTVIRNWPTFLPSSVSQENLLIKLHSMTIMSI